MVILQWYLLSIFSRLSTLNHPIQPWKYRNESPIITTSLLQQMCRSQLGNSGAGDIMRQRSSYDMNCSMVQDIGRLVIPLSWWTWSASNVSTCKQVFLGQAMFLLTRKQGCWQLRSLDIIVWPLHSHYSQIAPGSLPRKQQRAEVSSQAWQWFHSKWCWPLWMDSSCPRESPCLQR